MGREEGIGELAVERQVGGSGVIVGGRNEKAQGVIESDRFREQGWDVSKRKNWWLYVGAW